MVYSSSVEDALNKAKMILNKKDLEITIIPDGVSVIVED